jgi:hypothetical protein
LAVLISAAAAFAGILLMLLVSAIERLLKHFLKDEPCVGFPPLCCSRRSRPASQLFWAVAMRPSSTR